MSDEEFDEATRQAYWAVADHLEMACFFLAKVQEGDSAIRLRWCVNISASAIWSAFDILNNKVLEERLVQKTTTWFEDNESIVNLIRHGSVHFRRPHGYGEATGGPSGPETYIWIDCEGGQLRVPVGEVINRLAAAAQRIDDLAFARMHYRIISFS